MTANRFLPRQGVVRGFSGRWAARCSGWLGRVLVALAALGALGALLAATPARAGALPGELPALVGRLSALAGDVRWYDRDSGQWLASTAEQPLRNWPLAAGDRLRTGPAGRAELRIGSTTVRLDAHAELWLPRLDEQGILLHLQAGSMAVRLADVDRDGFGPVEMLTREGRWLPMRPGHYRLDRERDATQGSSWRGELRFESHDSTLSIPAGRRADLWQDPPGTTRYAWAGIERDAFADWVAREDRLDDAPQTARHVPPGMTGWQDLDRHGDWVDDPEYGSVWQPRVVAPGWAPFHDGRWAWVSPWGWTWIDAAPWGFAPFHYGSWVTVRGRWCWSPGPRHVAPRYAPALSAWISLPIGRNGSVNIGIGGGRPPPPRVVVPAPRPVIIVPPPRPRWTEPVRPPVVVVPREHDRHERGDRDAGRREPERRDFDRRDNDRRDFDRRDNDRRDNDRRDGDRREPDGRRPAPGAAGEPVLPRPDRGGGGGGRPERGEPRGQAPAPAAPVVPAAAVVAPVAPPVVRPPEAPRMVVPAPAPRAPREAEDRRDGGDARQPREPRDDQRRGGERGDRGDRGDRGERANWR